MPKCYNCGAEIAADDKLRLCDKCKSVLLPFIKFTDASTSSAVRRLITNERNLRARGVTDNGMDYLMRICEAHDREKAEEKQRREAETAPKQSRSAAAPQPAQPKKEEYLEIDLPMEPPLNFHRKPYGGLLSLLSVLLLLCGVSLLAWTVFRWISAETLSIPCIIAAVGAFAAAGICPPVKKLIHDMDELKKHFR